MPSSPSPSPSPSPPSSSSSAAAASSDLPTAVVLATSSPAAAALATPFNNPSPPVRSSLPPPCWTDDDTLVLIDAYREKWYSLRRGNLRAAHWDEVAEEVRRRSASLPASTPKTSVQCCHKIEKLRKRYRSERQRSLNHNPHVSPASPWIPTLQFFSLLLKGNEQEVSLSKNPLSPSPPPPPLPLQLPLSPQALLSPLRPPSFVTEIGLMANPDRSCTSNLEVLNRLTYLLLKKKCHDYGCTTLVVNWRRWRIIKVRMRW